MTSSLYLCIEHRIMKMHRTWHCLFHGPKGLSRIATYHSLDELWDCNEGKMYPTNLHLFFAFFQSQQCTRFRGGSTYGPNRHRPPPFWQINHANSAYFRLILGYFGVISAARPPLLDLGPPFLHILDPALQICVVLLFRMGKSMTDSPLAPHCWSWKINSHIQGQNFFVHLYSYTPLQGKQTSNFCILFWKCDPLSSPFCKNKFPPPPSCIATGGFRGQSSPPDREKIAKKRKKSGSFFHFAPPDR